MDLEDILFLRYGRFTKNKCLNEDKINIAIDFMKIIKYNDYKNHNITKINDIECSICLEKFIKEDTTSKEIIVLLNKYLNNKKIIINQFKNKKNQLVAISCFHIFHKNCLLDWYKENDTCPLCRIKLNVIK
jgi:hypothetical protein